MRSKSIEEAVIHTLKNKPEGLSPKEITKEIIKANLYEFKTLEPESVVTKSIRKTCIGVDLKISKPVSLRSFEKVGNDKYRLKQK